MASAPPSDLAARLGEHGQEHLLRFWDGLDDDGRARLAAELEALDLAQLDRLVETLVLGDGGEAGLDLDALRPGPVVRLDGAEEQRAAAAERGAAALAAGEVAVVVVAGGQGTRLGYDGPKGTFPIGPVSGATLFQLHAEQIAALERRHGAAIPLFVMTSPDNHEATAAFFAEHDDFGLDRVRLFVQGQMPAVDRESGRVLLAAPDHLALSPNGHGGTLAALAARPGDGSPSPLEELAERGVRTLFYFQVDNPLVHVADPVFVGLHREAGAEMSSKVVRKTEPGEKVGVVVEAGGRTHVIEYSDLPDALAQERRPDGSLAYDAGSIAIHLLERAFIERVATGGASLPFHRALKKVAYVGDDGEVVRPDEPNAVKFETFIFDALPLAERTVTVETAREDEFEPLKNAEGDSSPASVRRALGERWAGWLEQAGVTVPRDAHGELVHPLEISPRYALDAEELAARLPQRTVVDGPLRLG